MKRVMLVCVLCGLLIIPLTMIDAGEKEEEVTIRTLTFEGVEKANLDLAAEKFAEENDAGNHCSQYYNLTPYKNAAPLMIRFYTNNSNDMKNGDKLMIDEITIFAW